jgi:formamidopyrimidine-DNA glycosylase
LPELPEVETVCRGLRAKILGDVIEAVEVLRKDSIGYPAVSEFTRAVPGHTFESVSRRGKYILIGMSKKTGLAVHLRMSGQLLLVDKKAPPDKFLRVRMRLKSGRELHFADMRVFGRIWFVPPGKTFAEVIPTLAELGAEPLECLTGLALQDVFARRKQAIKSALLDQRLLAGVGNIYADESLFHSGINPLRPAGTLKLKELERLAEEIKNVLSRAIELGGTTFSDFKNSEGVNGNYQHDAWVYGRTGSDCRVCEEAILRVKIGGRSSHYCPQCQPKRRVK